MASINRLAIRGVRSFSPNDEEQAVEFFFPCTIIVGSNGCGKTTIIESLKYAMTGAFPPGNKSGQAFVHDPRSIGSQLVKAQVKLRFTSRAGKQMVVIRSMELTQKKTTLSFKQLDGALRTLDTNTGKIVSLSHKCTELDRQLPIMLGVSKPILEHVLFCHQEDASWPLQEGAVLKKRFDEIFDSTRYTKAIDVFRKTEKELAGKVKDLKADLAGLTSHRHAAHNFQKELSRHQEQLEQLDEDKKNLMAGVKEAEKKEMEAEETIGQLEDIQAEIEMASAQQTSKLEMLEKQRQMLEEDMTKEHQTAETLEKLLADYNRKVASQSDEFGRLQAQEKEFEQAIQQLRQKERSLAEQKTRLETEQEQQHQRQKERFSIMEHMARTYALDMRLSSTQNANTSLDASFLGASQNTSFTTAGAASTVTTDPAKDMTQEDVDQFFQAVDQKEKDLQEVYKETKARFQAEEDKLVATLSELEARRKAVESERQKILEQREKATAEQRDIMRQLSGHGRVRKVDVEDSRRQASRLAKERDEANNDPRRSQIPIEIRSYEEKIDSLKRQIEDDRMTLQSLRHCAENQNAITVLEEQCEKDLEIFVENFQEQLPLLQKHNLKPDQDVPKPDDDEDGRALVTFVEQLVDAVRDRYNALKSDLSSAEDDVDRTKGTLSEKTAAFSNHQQLLNSVKTRLGTLEGDYGSVAQAQKVFENLRRHESDLGLTPPAKDASPQDFISYLDTRLSEIEDDAPVDDAGIAKRLLKKLKRMAKVDDGDDGYRVVCPCCNREMGNSETKVFQEKMKELGSVSSPLVSTGDAEVEQYQRNKSSYEKWRRSLSAKLDDLGNCRRLREEKIQLERSLEELSEDLTTYQKTVAEHKENAQTIETEVDELRELYETCRRWSGDVARISEKRMQVGQKKQDLTLNTEATGRDLQTVERNLADNMEEKDGHMNKINRLNREMTSLNNRITQISTQAANVEKVAREKEAKFSATQKQEERKAELVELLHKMQEEDSKLQEQIAPLKRKVETKTREKERARSQRESEVSKAHNSLIAFQGDTKELRRITKAIGDFAAANQTTGLDRIASDITGVLDQVEEKKRDMKSLKSELDKLRGAVQDQERYKKTIRDNIDVLQTEKHAQEMGVEIDKLKAKLGTVEGHDTVYEDRKKASQLKQKRQMDLQRLEGRWMEVVEAIRSLKRKLSTAEYKNVDEEFRVANIKFHTTQLAAEDVKKYWTAVDKALLKYHSVKIGEINKIVRELWLLTYKGEDIGNIEIVSGQDSGSRSTRSYNYRVVMTKGNSQLDMRGRCSAGQRVLASIVIRLALAETFGVNCGCIALDEPTVNLDYANKKGLAVALAQIIASRAQQSNFQLILITHDEEFVSMVKTEMSMLTGFSMPDKYFHVRRERASDGKFYSKIDEKDWSELV